MDREFEKQRLEQMRKLGEDEDLKRRSIEWIVQSSKNKYSYNFDWCGLPIIQHPQDIVAAQEIIWKTKPDLVIETGIARGGSLVFWASMLSLLGGKGEVLGIDVDIRAHNRKAIEESPFAERIKMIEGSSTASDVIERVKQLAAGHEKIMVVLDSMHSHEHVAKELELYAPLVSKGCYLIVFDTIIEFMPEDSFPNRPWSIGNNPYTAVQEFLQNDRRFVLDKQMEDKLQITVAPGGYLKRVED